MIVAKLAVNRDATASTVEGAAVSSEVDDEVRVSRRDLVSVGRRCLWRAATVTSAA